MFTTFSLKEALEATVSQKPLDSSILIDISQKLAEGYKDGFYLKEMSRIFKLLWFIETQYARFFRQNKKENQTHCVQALSILLEHLARPVITFRMDDEAMFVNETLAVYENILTILPNQHLRSSALIAIKSLVLQAKLGQEDPAAPEPFFIGIDDDGPKEQEPMLSGLLSATKSLKMNTQTQPTKTKIMKTVTSAIPSSDDPTEGILVRSPTANFCRRILVEAPIIETLKRMMRVEDIHEKDGNQLIASSQLTGFQPDSVPWDVVEIMAEITQNKYFARAIATPRLLAHSLRMLQLTVDNAENARVICGLIWNLVEIIAEVGADGVGIWAGEGREADEEGNIDIEEDNIANEDLVDEEFAQRYDHVSDLHQLTLLRIHAPQLRLINYPLLCQIMFSIVRRSLGTSLSKPQKENRNNCLTFALLLCRAPHFSHFFNKAIPAPLYTTSVQSSNLNKLINTQNSNQINIGSGAFGSIAQGAVLLTSAQAVQQLPVEQPVIIEPYLLASQLPESNIQIPTAPTSGYSISNAIISSPNIIQQLTQGEDFEMVQVSFLLINELAQCECSRPIIEASTLIGTLTSLFMPHTGEIKTLSRKSLLETLLEQNQDIKDPNYQIEEIQQVQQQNSETQDNHLPPLKSGKVKSSKEPIIPEEVDVLSSNARKTPMKKDGDQTLLSTQQSLLQTPPSNSKSQKKPTWTEEQILKKKVQHPYQQPINTPPKQSSIIDYKAAGPFASLYGSDEINALRDTALTLLFTIAGFCPTGFGRYPVIIDMLIQYALQNKQIPPRFERSLSVLIHGCERSEEFRQDHLQHLYLILKIFLNYQRI
ncbi:MAG: hypothetical protein EZS28_007244 [Streblomastix strix]|uniref:Uncharacterized protein n=1 Tax=Streblomastix strix TaxID=222440 RepID=A0A5J4WQ12_9EUKA|nr:MAG: hypothetical protein EZS28_007244 [Streblomastix strix]